MKYPAIGLALFIAVPALYAETAPDTPAVDELKARHQSIQRELEQSAKERQQQRRRLEQLQQQLDCHWTLIQDYQNCDERHQGNAQAHASCTRQARQRAEACAAEAP